MDEDLFREHIDWVVSIAESVARGMPPSFDVEDLKQLARIEHWRCVQRYDPSRGVPYRAFAYFAIRGAVLMGCRRKHYREATHEELSLDHADNSARADVALLRREAQRNVLGPRARRKLDKVRAALGNLSAVDAYLVRRVYLEDADEEALSKLWNIDSKAMGRRLRAAVGKLKRSVGV